MSAISNEVYYNAQVFDNEANAVVNVQQSTTITLGNDTFVLPNDIYPAAQTCSDEQKPFTVANPAPVLSVAIFANKDGKLPAAGSSKGSVEAETSILGPNGPAVYKTLKVTEAVIDVRHGTDFSGRPYANVTVTAGSGVSRTDATYAAGSVEGNSTKPCQPMSANPAPYAGAGYGAF